MAYSPVVVVVKRRSFELKTLNDVSSFYLESEIRGESERCRKISKLLYERCVRDCENSVCMICGISIEEYESFAVYSDDWVLIKVWVCKQCLDDVADVAYNPDGWKNSSSELACSHSTPHDL